MSNTLHVPSPYGASKQDPTLIIIHAMGEYIKDGIKVYTAREWLDKLKLSAHALIHPDGHITRMRKDKEGAYHAKRFNTDSLGVEFLVPGIHSYKTFKKAIKEEYVTEQAIESGKDIIKYWLDTYMITQIVGHSEIDPQRKVDPGTGFPWEKIEEIV